MPVGLLFDPDQPAEPRPLTEGARLAAEARAVGLAAVEEHADMEWLDVALEFVRRFCETHRVFISDDLWADGLPVPMEARALGVVMRKAARAGWIRKSGSYAPSVSSRGAPRPVWESRVYR